MSIDPRHLANLLAVVRHGSFNRAAAARGLSQPALSNSMAALERRLGVRVMDRSRQGSSLTKVGEILARRAQTLEHLLDQIEDEVKLQAAGTEGPLMIGVTPSAMLRLMPEALELLLARVPNIALSVVEGLDDELVARLQGGEIDLLVCPVAGLHAPPPGIVEEVLLRDAFSIGVAPGHRLARRKSLQLAELADDAWVLPMTGSSYRRHLEAIFMANGVPWPVNCVAANSMALIENLVLNTGRIAIISQLQAASRKRGGMSSIPLAGAGARMIGFKRRAEGGLPPVAESFITALREACKHLNGDKPDV